MIYSIRLGIQSQSVTPDFRDSNMGQFEKDSGLFLCLVRPTDNRGCKLYEGCHERFLKPILKIQPVERVLSKNVVADS